MNKQSNKTRHISIYQLFERLQIEYIVAELRKKIYPRAKDKDYYKKIMAFKEEKVRDISKRNNLPSIFNDSIIREKMYALVYTKGYPNFHYEGAINAESFKEKDLLYYYNVGSEVRINYDNSNVEVGVIRNCDFQRNLVEVDVRNSIKLVPLYSIVRIL